MSGLMDKTTRVECVEVEGALESCWLFLQWVLHLLVHEIDKLPQQFCKLLGACSGEPHL